MTYRLTDSHLEIYYFQSRQKFTVPGKNIPKRFDSETDNSLENRVKKKIASNPLIQRNINFLQTYNNLFRKPSNHFGDADSYFKKSLRSYGALDIIRDLNLQSHFVKTAKSFDSIAKVSFCHDFIYNGKYKIGH